MMVQHIDEISQDLLASCPGGVAAAHFSCRVWILTGGFRYVVGTQDAVDGMERWFRTCCRSAWHTCASVTKLTT